jgi:MFS family permease
MNDADARSIPIGQESAWWREMSRYHWWVLAVATLGWLFDSMDQRLFVLARTPALRTLVVDADETMMVGHAARATAIFIVGWATGGLVFGLLGDRLGRARTMMITILLYSLFTGLSALAQSWWDFALYRFVCGAGIGGEYAAGVALVAETVPHRARPYCLGLLQGLAALGHVSGSLISLVIGPQAQYGGIAGWRLLFLVGILPALLAVVIRRGLHEPDSWVKARARALGEGAAGSDELHRQMGDLREILGDRRWRHRLLIGMNLGIAGQVGIWGIGFWSPELIRAVQLQERQSSFGVQLDTAPREPALRQPAADLIHLATRITDDAGERQAVLQRWHAEDDRYVGRATVLQDLAGMLGIYVCTYLAARAGRRPAFAASYVAALGATVFVFGGLRRGVDSLWMMPLLGFGVSSVFGAFAIYFPELFPTRLRSTGTGFCYNVARYITALGPLTFGQLTLAYGALGYALPLRPAAITLAAIYLVGLGTLLFAPETKGGPLPE